MVMLGRLRRSQGLLACLPHIEVHGRQGSTYLRTVTVQNRAHCQQPEPLVASSTCTVSTVRLLAEASC
jgi:hypothetical protein